MAQNIDKELADGLRGLAEGSLLMLVAYIVFLGLAWLAGFWMLMPFYMPMHMREVPYEGLYPRLIALVVVLVFLVIAIYGLVSKIQPGLASLGRWRQDLSGLVPLAVWGLAFGYVLLGVFALLTVLQLPGRFIALWLSFILGVIGYIGLGITALKLGTYLGSGVFTLGGAFALISSLIPVFAPITWLVLYIEASGQAYRVAQGGLKS
ncbi:MAG: hypothetical protein ACP5GL_07605 [Infirmifilum sp.]